MAYIRGTQEFYGRSFTVSPAVLIPRWETELLIEEALAWLRAQGGAAEVADIGTGSGCIAVSLAAEVPTARLTATDISADALEVARVNAGRFGVDGRVRFVHGTYLAGLPGPFDLIVANPPYVRAGDASALQPEVRDHEPSVALYGGDDGMRDVRAVLGEAVRALRPGGRLVMELGAGQDDVVMALAAATPGLGDARMCEDLQGIPRVLVATRA